MKNTEDNIRKRKTNHPPCSQSPSDSKSDDGTKSDSAFRPVFRDVSNQNPTLPSSGSTQHWTQPSTHFSSGNPYYGAFPLPILVLCYCFLLYQLLNQ